MALERRTRVQGVSVVLRARDGRWQFDFKFRGTRYRRNGGDSHQQAHAAAKALIGDLATGKTPNRPSKLAPRTNAARSRPRASRRPDPTEDPNARTLVDPKLYRINLRECSAGYLAHVKRTGSVHSERTARRVVANIVAYFGERTLAASLTDDRVQTFLESVRTPFERSKAGRYLKAMLNHAVSRERLPALPCRVKVPRTRPIYRPALKPEEVQALLDAADWRTFPLLLLAVTSGGRHRELTSRQWRDFDPETPSLTISPQPDANFLPKTEESTRQVRLPRFTAEQLMVYHLELETAADRPLTSTDWIFPNTPGSDRPWEQQKVCKAVREVFDEAGLGDIPGAGLHCLRRTWATTGLESGGSIATVQREGGWASPKVLLESYARPTEEQRARLAEGVSDALGLRSR